MLIQITRSREFGFWSVAVKLDCAFPTFIYVVISYTLALQITGRPLVLFTPFSDGRPTPNLRHWENLFQWRILFLLFTDGCHACFSETRRL